MNARIKLAGMLKDIGAVKTGKFKFASGKESNIYADCRLATLDAITLREISIQMVRLLKTEKLDFNCIGGLTMGADPLVGGMLQRFGDLDHPMKGFLVRKEPKQHGTGQLVEGHLEYGAKAVVVDDVVTSGGSTQKAIDAVRTAGATVTAVAVIIDREEGAKQRFEAAGIPLFSLLTLKELVELLV